MPTNLRGTGGILPLNFSKNVQTPANGLSGRYTTKRLRSIPATATEMSKPTGADVIFRSPAFQVQKKSSRRVTAVTRAATI
ncbi:MAG TPA: hypothetical protein VMW38_17570 [Terriglobia bacterium]|nr:hypothetical protein [Terriglobia bacterium]